MKKRLIFGFAGLMIVSMFFIGMSVSAAPLDAQTVNSTILELDDSEEGYTLESMLTYALLDEYLAQATYAKIIEFYGEIRPFSKIALAEQTHIDLLLPLFETYGIEIPFNDASDEVIVPDSIASALATGVEAEKANLLMYETFLAQHDLPEDVKTVFELLHQASQKHLNALSKDRIFGAGYDLAYQWRKAFGQGGRQKGNTSGSNMNQCTNR